MSKTTIITLIVVVFLGIGAYLFNNNPLTFGSIGVVEKLSKSFMEDLQFKDFRSTQLYSHGIDKDRLDIGKAIERLFLTKPEFLDILDYRVSRAELDDSGTRAKVIVRTRFKILNKDKKPREGYWILYWSKRHPDCPLGSDCNAESTCINERGAIVYQRDEKEPETKKKNSTKDPDPDDPNIATNETYTCLPGKPHEWFMNIDSTLKDGKLYDDPKDTK